VDVSPQSPSGRLAAPGWSGVAFGDLPRHDGRVLSDSDTNTGKQNIGAYTPHVTGRCPEIRACTRPVPRLRNDHRVDFKTTTSKDNNGVLQQLNYRGGFSPRRPFTDELFLLAQQLLADSECDNSTCSARVIRSPKPPRLPAEGAASDEEQRNNRRIAHK
jgi:hypothetical protein